MPTVLQNDVKEIFYESLRREAGDDREIFIANVCGENLELRNEVNALLASLDETRTFLETPLISESELELGTSSLPPGRMISHYRIESLLGCGGMGEVYLATDNILKRPVALKVVPESVSADTARVRRFEREAKAIAELNHPNILTIYEFATASKKHFIVSEFIKGETVRKRLARGPMPIQEVLDVAIQTAAALASAHRACVIHRDIKPENIMIRDDGYVKILDFGLAKLTAVPERELSVLLSMTSQPGLIMGTSQYVSPEQARGLAVDHRTDLFSLGIVIYEMLTGIQPFRGENAIDVVADIIQADPPPVEELDGNIPKSLSAVIVRLLQKEPTDRYPDAAELRQDLISIRDEINDAFPRAARFDDDDLEILEMPTNEYPVPSNLELRYALYFLLLSLALAAATAFFAFRLSY